MKETRPRRRTSRHPLRWKAAVAFDAAQRRPIVHTHTFDLSDSGAAIFSDHEDLTGSDVTLLLARPPRRGEATPRVLKLRARVVSTARVPGMARYRHGLSFMRLPDDTLDVLAETLKDVGTAAVAPGPKPAAAVSSATSTVQEIDLQVEVSDALERVYHYLEILVARFNGAKPAFPRGYAIAGVREFNGLAWESGHAELHVRDVSPKVRLCERVSLRYLLSGKKQIRVARDYPASDKLQELLRESDIEFVTQGIWSKRGSLERTTFEFPCEVRARLEFTGDFETGELRLRTRNVSGFGSLEQILMPGAVSAELLDELGVFILGQSASLGP